MGNIIERVNSVNRIKADDETKVAIANIIEQEVQYGFGQISSKLDSVGAELKSEINNVRVELKSEISRLDSKIDRLDGKIENVQLELKSELKSEISRLDNKIENVRVGLYSKFKSLENLNKYVIGLVTAGLIIGAISKFIVH